MRLTKLPKWHAVLSLAPIFSKLQDHQIPGTIAIQHPPLSHGYCLPGMSLHFLKIWDLAVITVSHSLFHHLPSTTTLAAIFWSNHPLPGLSATWVPHQQEAHLLPHQPTPPHSHSPFPTEILWSSQHPLLLALSCILSSSPVIWVFYYCLINYHNNSSLKQHTFIISASQWVRGKA